MPNFRFINKILVNTIRTPPQQKIKPKIVFKTPFEAIDNIGDQIQKYVVKDHGFPFLKWCDTL